MGFRKVWQRAIHTGVDNDSRDYRSAGVILANKISLILLMSVLLCLVALLFAGKSVGSVNLIVMTGILVLVLLLNKAGLVNASRIVIAMAPCLTFFVPSVIGFQEHTAGIIFYSYAIVTLSAIPVLVFDIRKERWLLFSSLLVNLLAFLIIEPVLFRTMEPHAIFDFLRENYLLFKIVSTTFWFFFVTALLSMSGHNKINQEKVEFAMAQLEQKNLESKMSLEELKMSNDELRQQQEQISAQRDFIELKNKELKKYQEKLLDYVFEVSKAQDLLAEKEAENFSLLKALRENFFMVEFDRNGRITWLTPKTLSYLEMKEEEIVGMRGTDLVTKIDEDNTINANLLKLWDRIIGGDSVSADMELSINKRKIHVSSTFAPIIDQGGKIVKVLTIAEDISDIISQKKQISEINQLLLQQQKEIKDQNEELTQQKEEIGAMNETLEERVKERTIVLEQKNKQLAEYAFINAHLLRSPVSSILGLINLLEYEKLNEEERNIFNYMKKTVKQLDSIVFKINKAIQQNKDFDREFLRE